MSHKIEYNFTCVILVGFEVVISIHTKKNEFGKFRKENIHKGKQILLTFQLTFAATITREFLSLLNSSWYNLNAFHKFIIAMPYLPNILSYICSPIVILVENKKLNLSRKLRSLDTVPVWWPWWAVSYRNVILHSNGIHSFPENAQLFRFLYICYFLSIIYLYICKIQFFK